MHYYYYYFPKREKCTSFGKHLDEIYHFYALKMLQYLSTAEEDE